MKLSVGLVVMTLVPDESGRGVPAAVLQRRGMWNMEKNKPESYQGCCQVTAHGKLEGEEDPIRGIRREVCEELGERFLLFLDTAPKVVTLIDHKEDEKRVVTFGVFMNYNTLKEIRLGPDSGGLDIIKVSEVQGLSKIEKHMKETGCPPVVRALFEDEIEAIKKAFEIFDEIVTVPA